MLPFNILSRNATRLLNFRHSKCTFVVTTFMILQETSLNNVKYIHAFQRNLGHLLKQPINSTACNQMSSKTKHFTNQGANVFAKKENQTIANSSIKQENCSIKNDHLSSKDDNLSINNVLIKEKSLPIEEERLTNKEKLKRAISAYGSTVIVFHVTISLISLGTCYLLVASGVDLKVILDYLNLGDVGNKLATNAGTFVVAYAIHKVFAPVRIAITLTSTPFIVRYLRRIGILKTTGVKK